jgi:tRNA nucleotidyltransferase (CCA-adding enzyme)
MLMEADHSGRSPLPKGCPESVREIVSISKELGVKSDVPVPIIMGRHLIEKGLTPSPKFGMILKRMYEKQLEGDFETLEEGLRIINQEISLDEMWPALNRLGRLFQSPKNSE